jgi:hypothetical protein
MAFWSWLWDSPKKMTDFVQRARCIIACLLPQPGLSTARIHRNAALPPTVHHSAGKKAWARCSIRSALVIEGIAISVAASEKSDGEDGVARCLGPPKT